MVIEGFPGAFLGLSVVPNEAVRLRLSDRSGRVPCLRLACLPAWGGPLELPVRGGAGNLFESVDRPPYRPGLHRACRRPAFVAVRVGRGPSLAGFVGALAGVWCLGAAGGRLALVVPAAEHLARHP